MTAAPPSPLLLTPVLTRLWAGTRPWTLDSYRRHGGYEALVRALTMTPDEVVAAVAESGLRGRGGAGFPTAAKWSALPDDGRPRYLVVNAHEAEPGACKDIPLLLTEPHRLVEGIAITAYAIGAATAFVYVRGEVVPAVRRLHRAVAEAYRAGVLGPDALGRGAGLDVVVHAGAGAYVCGEETALCASLEGRRGEPRSRPPRPTSGGLYGCPTVVNNVETIASVPAIVANGPAWYRSMGTAGSPGCALFTVSGHVARPGVYEAPFGVTARELIAVAGGIRRGHRLKFWTPGGASSPILTAAHLDVPLDHGGVRAAGSALGSTALQVFDETTCVVRAVARWSEFYASESCGKCAPCRLGTSWTVRALRDLELGTAPPSTVDELLAVAGTVAERSFCALGEGATRTVVSAVRHFRDEFAAHAGGCPFDPALSTVFGARP